MSSGKTIEIPKHVQLSSHEIEGEGAGNDFLYSSADSSLKEGVETFSTVDGLPIDCCQKVVFSENFPALGDSISSGGPMIGLKLGKRTYFEDMCAAASSSKTAAPISIIPTSSAATARRSRVSNHDAQAPHCQVEGCHLDLKSAKEYHRRHRICESHSKSPRVVVAGVELRFCQQCSRQVLLVELLLEFYLLVINVAHPLFSLRAPPLSWQIPCCSQNTTKMSKSAASVGKIPCEKFSRAISCTKFGFKFWFWQASHVS